jgi:hypothetical protein
VVLVSENARDIAYLGYTALQENDHLPLLPVKKGEEVGEHEVGFHLGLWSLPGDGVGQFDEPDFDLGPLAVELALEVLPRIRLVLGEVIFNAVGADSVEYPS